MSIPLLPLLLAALLLLQPTPANAAVISTCPATCTSDCQLGPDFVCPVDTLVGVTLTNGADLDLAGNDLKCSAYEGDFESCQTAVSAGPNSRVWTSVPRSPAHNGSRIVGRWTSGVVCTGGGAQTRVSGIQLRGWFSGDAAILRCQTVEDNTVIGEPGLVFGGTSASLFPPSYGIVARTATGSNSIARNFIEGFISPVYRSPTPGPGALTIENNTISYRDHGPTATQATAIYLFATVDRPATVANNIIYGDGKAPLIYSNPSHSVTLSNNVCKGLSAGCADCVASGKCAANGICLAP